MKKILLSTTVLVASAGFAVAEISISGTAAMDVDYSDVATSKKTTVSGSIDLNWDASFAADNGMTMAVHMDNVATGDADVKLTGDFGSVTFGTPSNAEGTVSALGAGSVDNNAEGYLGGTTDSRWDYTMDGISIAVSGNSNGENSAASLKYTSGTLAIAVAHNSLTNASSWNGASVSTTLGAMTVKAMVANKNGAASNGIGATFDAATLGLGTVTLAFAGGESQTNSWGINMKKDMGGLTLNANWVDAQGSNSAQAGITMGF